MKFADLLNQKPHEDIWVMNSTKGDRRGNVFFTVPNNTGTREDQVTVFATFVPTNLTAQVTRRQLLDSSSFRRSVTVGMLQLVTSEEAEQLLQQPGAQEEYDRVAKMTIGSATAEAQYGVGHEKGDEAVAASSAVSVPVAQFIALLDTTDDPAALVTLRNMGQLNIDEYRAVLSRAKELHYENVGKYAASSIAEIKNKVQSRDSY